MTKKQPTEPKERAAVGRERRLALALRAVLDAAAPYTAAPFANNENDDLERAAHDAIGVLHDLGYKDIESIPRRVAAIEAELKAAMESGNGKEIARLGLELDRAKVGLPPTKARGEKVGAVDA